MYRNFTLTALFVLICSITFAQTPHDATSTPNTYRQADNPYYWKNKLPYEGYWQQDVHYHIKAEIDIKTNIIHGLEKITYWNNSPDTLNHVFFHLYQNAFQPESYYDNMQKNNGEKTKYGKYESQGLGNEIIGVKGNGKLLDTEIDNTVMKVMLDQPIAPNSSYTFYVKFNTYYDKGSVRRRMKYFNSYGAKQYNGAHWYPSLCVYDKKFGWSTDQHLGREFYSNFGTFDLELTFPANYVVEATGVLQNAEEVLPDTLREKLDIKNFAEKPWGEKPSVITPYDSTEKKTWIYHSENVHNVAFIANPHFRLSEFDWNGVKSIAVAQEPHCSGWVDAAEYTANILKVFSEDFGMYGYPKMIVSDARDGMEYPMLTMDGGKDPSFRGLLVHEVGHNWFYGMVANNETYRANMDEGFTQFLTAWGLIEIDGENLDRKPIESNYERKFKDSVDVMNRRVYYAYLRDALKYEDSRLNEHSNKYWHDERRSGGYRHVYYKMATVLYNLQYVLGDELFLKAMQNYFQQWSFCHPYPEDFRQSIMDYTKTDLNWFFDDWLESTKTVDYAVKSVKKDNDKGGDNYVINLKRKDRMSMPIDLRVIANDGKVHDFYIPNTWFEKETDATKLPKWFGWDDLHPTYEAKVNVPSGIKNVIIDPSNRLGDRYMLDNSKKLPVDFNFDSHISNYPDARTYRLNARPDIWYNSYDGIKIGAHMNGNYMRHKHKLHLSVWYNTRLLQGGFDDFETSIEKKNNPISFVVGYSSGLDRVIKKGEGFINYRYLDGLEMMDIGLRKSFLNNIKTTLAVKYMYRPRTEDLQYLLYEDEWNAGMYNTSLNFEFLKGYKSSKSRGKLDIDLRSSALFSDYDYHYISAEWTNTARLWRFDLKTRIYARYGTGSNVAPESSLFMATANPEEMMLNKYTRSKGFFPNEWAGTFGPTTNHFYYGGGMNLRGYAGYYAVEQDKNGNNNLTYKGNSGASVSFELDFDRLFAINAPKLKKSLNLDTYIFGDGGSIVYTDANNKKAFSAFRMDAGVGTALTIKKFWKFTDIKPLTLRLDMPLVLSHTPFQESEHYKFRWMFSINRTF